MTITTNPFIFQMSLIICMYSLTVQPIWPRLLEQHPFLVSPAISYRFSKYSPARKNIPVTDWKSKNEKAMTKKE